ncbi:MAG: tRNA (adenosine(37)-N6)-threonylcarbamoyltransferase complex dimerization subunit type 1 TsaB [Bacilli bacterium]
MTSLFIDTHLYDIVVIIFINGKVIKEDNIKNAKSLDLIQCIKKIANLDSIDEILVVNGPGSFTGIRTGITVAKTIAYTKNIPIKMFSYLDLITYSLNNNYNIVGLYDNSGIYIGHYNNYKLIKDYEYIKKVDLPNYIDNNKIITDVSIDYEKAFSQINKIKYIDPKKVNPLYIKLISVEYDKKSF